MSIVKKYLDKNQTFIYPVKQNNNGIAVHSTGCGYKNKDKLFVSWNNAKIEKSAHGIVDETGSYNTLPLDIRGWHVGGKGNKHLVGFEICEPSFIVYADKYHTKVDTKKYNPNDAKIKEDFLKRYNNAVVLAAWMCKELNITDMNMIRSHAEWHKAGEGSNHADVGHWFPLFGKNMDTFRADVKKMLDSERVEMRYRVQLGAFKVKKYAEAYCKNVQKQFKDAYVTAKDEKGYYRVQIGSFKNRDYALALLDKVTDAGYSAIIKEYALKIV